MRILLCLLACLCAAAPAMAANPSPRQEPVTALPQWQDFSQRQQRSLQALASCEQNPSLCESKEIRRWSGLVTDLKAQNKLRQLITVNRWFNRLPYKYDEYAYDKLDYWADTASLLTSRGDCEDFALSKYYTLRRLGFSPDELKVTIVYDQEKYANHAVLMVYMNGTRYMLDSSADDMNPSPMEYRYKTIYAFNENNAWFYQ
ncbi:MAG TPA: transglutaminase-like cysteine peptidase [Micavibrio sp.]|nr:transglutaminase-like cysteine peptidase [Micavibrio sp.]